MQSFLSCLYQNALREVRAAGEPPTHMKHVKKPGLSRKGGKIEQDRQEITKVNVSASKKVSPLYVHYLKALKLLADRVNASPEEMVGWVMLGSKFDGLDAFRNPHSFTLAAPFSIYGYAEDYLSLMMHCWFRIDDVMNFRPKERFITGRDLIKRWSGQLGIKAVAFIRTKVNEGDLYDFHPRDQTQWRRPEYLASKETTLFLMSQVRNIEVECFFHAVSTNEDEPVVETSRKSVFAKDIRKFFAFWDEKRWKAVLSSPPKWMEDARIKPVVHRKGALWNPAVLGNCLLAYRLKYWYSPNKCLQQFARVIPSKTQLERIIQENFPEWLSEWQPDLE